MAFPRFEPVPDSGPPPLFAGDGVADNTPTDRGDATHTNAPRHTNGPTHTDGPSQTEVPSQGDPPSAASGAAPGAFPPDPSPDAATLRAAFSTALTLVDTVPTDVTLFDTVSNHTIEDLHRQAGDLVRKAGLLFSLTAAQIHRRSAPSLGKDGMARKSGHRTPEAMTTTLGGVNRHDAIKAVRDGNLIHTTQTTDNAAKTGTDPVDPLTQEPIVVDEPWLIGVGRARTAGMSRDCADAIRSGLGTPTAEITVEMLRTAADHLCTEAARLGPDQLLLQARRLRDSLDAAGIGLREDERHQKRSLKVLRRPDGMTQLVLLLDTENAARVLLILDNATSPKLGGPRTAPGEQAEHAQQILDDTRTPAQLGLDTFVHLLTAGADADDSELLGSGAPAIRILTTAPIPGRPAPAKPTTTDSVGGIGGHADRDGIRVIPAHRLYGPGWIEGHHDPVSADTIARITCTGSTSTITFDDTGQPIDVSAEQRLFSRRQRTALAARDGGCMWTDTTGTTTCERPPSWTEAHHIEHWDRDGGKTTILNGILLCRYHHLTLHNDGWEIYRIDTRYWLVPPAAVDPAQTPRLIRSRSNAYSQLDHVVHRTGPATPATAPSPADTAPPVADAAPPPTATWAESSPDDATDHITSNGSAYRLVPRRSSTSRATDSGSDLDDANAHPERVDPPPG